MNRPKLALCNFIPDTKQLKEFAATHGFGGVDWTFTAADLPSNQLEESRLLRKIAKLHPLEVRYHCAFDRVDMGDADIRNAHAAMRMFRGVCRLVSRLDGKFITIHLGLGRNSTYGLVWERTLESLSKLVTYADGLGITVCLENLAWGWSSRPELFEKLIRKSGAGVTLDIGHAQVCASVESQHYAIADFVTPHAERVFNAHIYHEEHNNRHWAPTNVQDVSERLELLTTLPCDWWVLELREVQPLLDTLQVVRQFLQCEAPRLPLDAASLK